MRKVLDWSGIDMKKVVWSGLATAVAVLAMSTPAQAQLSASDTVSVSATVSGRAKLDVNIAAISFADEDPDVVALIPASAAVGIDVKVRTTANGAVSLTLKADQDLTDTGTSATIPISNLKWTVAGAGLAAGTAATSDVVLGSWTGSGNRNGLLQNYTLDNSWAYATGTYSAVMTYTLTAP
jgi:hypothetical protein